MAFAGDENKRRSIRKGRQGKRVGPIPDGDISGSTDRAHISWLYRDVFDNPAIRKRPGRLLLMRVA